MTSFTENSFTSRIVLLKWSVPRLRENQVCPPLTLLFSESTFFLILGHHRTVSRSTTLFPRQLLTVSYMIPFLTIMAFCEYKTWREPQHQHIAWKNALRSADCIRDLPRFASRYRHGTSGLWFFLSIRAFRKLANFFFFFFLQSWHIWSSPCNFEMITKSKIGYFFLLFF